jgi:predicted patatin/cPLA2 family phospholipase
MSKSNPKKLALILSGGGMTTSYCVGALQALRQKHRIVPDIIIAASGSAGSASYYVSKQDKYFEHFWLDLLPKHQDIVNAFRFTKIIDIDFIVDVLMKEEMSLNLKNLRAARTKLFLPVVHWKNGNLKYFSNHDDVDWYAVVKAAKAIPIAYGRSVKILTERYHDSHKTSMPSTHIKKAVQEGATHIWIVNLTHKDQKFSKFAFLEGVWNLLVKRSKFRRGYRKIGPPKQMPKVQILTTSPSREPEASMLDIRADDIQDTILLGYQDSQSDAVKAFISDFRKAK